MRIFLLFLLIQIQTNHLFAQPLGTNPIQIDAINYYGKLLCFSTENGWDYKLYEKNKSGDCNKEYYPKSIISVNEISKFIYKKDTMRLLVDFDEYSLYQFSIQTLYFQKGLVHIDLKQCLEKLDTSTYPTIIKNFPCDCIAYRKESEE